MNSISVPNSLYPDQARHYVGPDLDPNRLQRLSVSTSGGGGVILPTRLGGPIFQPGLCFLAFGARTFLVRRGISNSICS